MTVQVRVTIYLILAVSLILVAVVSLYNYKLIRQKKRARAYILLPVTLCLNLLAALLISIAIEGNTYERLTKEHTIATIEFSSLAPQHYRAVLKQSHQNPITVELHGDQWQLDARIFKWKGIAQWAGLQPMYQLERISGRYQNLSQENNAQHSAKSIAQADSVDFWNLLIEHQDSIPWLDVQYGNAVYLPMKDGAKFMIKLSQTGLLARPRNYKASQSVKNWLVSNS